MLGTGALVRGEAGWQLDHAAPRELPEALERLVRSRVDRLGAIARETIVAASVLGAEFSLSTVAAVSAVNGELPQALAELCSAGLITRLRQLPEPSFRFRHALIQDATYKGLLRGQRRQLHAKAAWALEEAAVGRLEVAAGLLVHHSARGGEPGRAVHYLELAGDHAASAFANDEAVASYLYGLDLLGNTASINRGLGRDTTVNAETEIVLSLHWSFRLWGVTPRPVKRSRMACVGWVVTISSKLLGSTTGWDGWSSASTSTTPLSACSRRRERGLAITRRPRRPGSLTSGSTASWAWGRSTTGGTNPTRWQPCWGGSVR